MSIQAISWVFEHSEAEGNARLVLLSIANHADREGEDAWPKAETIALESRCDRATVFRCLNKLREMGEVDWVSGGGREGQRRRSNYYWMPKMRLRLGLSPKPSQNATLSPQGRTGPPTRSQNDIHKVARVRLEPSLAVHTEPAISSTKPNPEGAAKAREILRDLAAKKSI